MLARISNDNHDYIIDLLKVFLLHKQVDSFMLFNEHRYTVGHTEDLGYAVSRSNECPQSWWGRLSLIFSADADIVKAFSFSTTRTQSQQRILMYFFNLCSRFPFFYSLMLFPFSLVVTNFAIKHIFRSNWIIRLESVCWKLCGKCYIIVYRVCRCSDERSGDAGTILNRQI